MENGSREGIGATRRNRGENEIKRKLTAIPTGSCRPPYSSMGLGSREAQAKAPSTAQTGSHKISRRTRHRVDRWCMRTVPSREVSEWTPGGGKEGRWRRRSRRATPARIPPPKGPGREESAFSRPSATGDVARSGLASARSFSPTSTGDRPLSPCLLLSFLREEGERSLLPGCLRLNSESARREEEEEEEEEGKERARECARGRGGRNERTRSAVSPGLVGEEETAEEKRRRRRRRTKRGPREE